MAKNYIYMNDFDKARVSIYKAISGCNCYEYREELQKKENSESGYVYKLLQRIDPDEASKLHPNATRYIIRALEIYHET